MARSDIFAFMGDYLVLAGNSVTPITQQPGQNAIQIKIHILGGTLSIGGATGSIQPWSGIGMTFGLGYIIATNEVCVSNMSGTTYLWNQGATTTVCILGGNSTQPG